MAGTWHCAEGLPGAPSALPPLTIALPSDWVPPEDGVTIRPCCMLPGGPKAFRLCATCEGGGNIVLWQS